MSSNSQTASVAGSQSIAASTSLPRAIAAPVSISQRGRNKRLGLTISYVILIIAVIFALYPVYFAFLVSVRPNGQLISVNLLDTMLPTAGISFDSYAKMITNTPDHTFLPWLGNSLFVAITTALASVVLCTSAAFVISRFKFRGRNALLILFLAIQSFPALLALAPITILLTQIGLYRNLLGLILAYSAGSLVFSTWNLKGYFDTIPVEIEEAALIDGCNTFQSFFRVLLPLSLPAVALTAFFGFLAGWGEYVLASAIIPSPTGLQTLPVALANLSQSTSVPWGLFAAGSMIVAIPTMIAFLLMQKNLQSGLTAGGVKG
jgi:arabinogalactan oligomer/maltooligosaccharide transport system permease protein